MTGQRGADADSDSGVASIGSLFAHETRCRMMLALSNGSMLSAARLAAEANVTAATASSHLKKLTDAGLLTVTRQGRNRYYRIAGPEVGDLIEALERVAPVVAARSLRQSTQIRQWREARICYNHIAGRLGVEILDGFVALGYLVPLEPVKGARGGRRPEYGVSESGAKEFSALGLHVEAGERVEGHNDPTESRPHIGGRFAHLLMERLIELGWIVKTSHRAVRVTDLGVEEMGARFGLSSAA